MRGVLCAAILACAAGAASATVTVSQANGPVITLEGIEVGGFTPRTPAGTTYTAFTGLATPTSLLLIEPTAPALRDDVVTFDGVSEQINDYVTGAARFVNESVVSNGAGGFDLTISINVFDAAGAPGNMFPAGFSGGSPAAPLTRGGVGLGLNLGTALGNDPLNFVPAGADFVSAASITIFRADGTNASLALPTSFFGAPAAWNGVVGVILNGVVAADTATTRVTGVQWNISTIPTPGAVALLGLGGLIASRRRRA